MATASTAIFRVMWKYSRKQRPYVYMGKSVRVRPGDIFNPNNPSWWPPTWKQRKPKTAQPYKLQVFWGGEWNEFQETYQSLAQ